MAENFIEPMVTEEIDTADGQQEAITRLPKVVEEYERLLERKQALKSESEKNDEAIKAKGDELCQVISDARLQNFSFGGYTYTPGTQHKYYLITDEVAFEKGIEDRFAPFEEDDALCDLVHKDINWRSMQTSLKELEENGGGIPEEVLKVLNIKDEFGVSRRKTSMKNAQKVATALEKRRSLKNV